MTIYKMNTGRTRFKKGHKVNLGRVVSNETKNKISMAIKGRVFSEEHIEKLRISHIGLSSGNKGKARPKLMGEKNGQWKGGKTSENLKIRSRIEFRLWREAVYARDNWVCQKCFNRGGILNAHHIINFSSCIELRFAIDNGITLCKECHQKYHFIYGKKNNNKEQLENFIKKANDNL